MFSRCLPICTMAPKRTPSKNPPKKVVTPRKKGPSIREVFAKLVTPTKSPRKLPPFQPKNLSTDTIVNMLYEQQDVHYDEMNEDEAEEFDIGRVIDNFEDIRESRMREAEEQPVYHDMQPAEVLPEQEINPHIDVGLFYAKRGKRSQPSTVPSIDISQPTTAVFIDDAQPSTSGAIDISPPSTSTGVTQRSSRRTARRLTSYAVAESNSDDSDDDDLHTRTIPGGYSSQAQLDFEVPDDGDDNLAIASRRQRQMCHLSDDEAEVDDEDGAGGRRMIGGVPSVMLPAVAHRPKIVWKLVDHTDSDLTPLPFTPENVGLRQDLRDKELDELQCCELFLPENFWQEAAYETNKYHNAYKTNPDNNKYANSKRAKYWVDATTGDMKTYMGIIMLFGIYPPADLWIIWDRRSPFFNEYISNSMSFNRFIEIHRFFHLVDSDTLPPNDTKAYRTARFQPLLDTLRNACISVYKHDKPQISLDEGCMGWKGHSRLVSYNPQKPHKYHIKFYKLCTPDGYLSNILLNDTTSRTVDEIVLSMVTSSCYRPHEGYCVYTDRFYTSPDLAVGLLDIGFDFIGTCNANRHQMPPELRVEKKKGKDAPKKKKGQVVEKRKRGDLLVYKAGPPHKIVALRWLDSKDVHMVLTTDSGRVVPVTSKRGINRTKPKPSVIGDYNIHMGGVDLNDMLEEAYSFCRTTNKLWRKVTNYLIGLAVNNGLYVYRLMHPKTYPAKKSGHAAFITKIATMLITTGSRMGPVATPKSPRLAVPNRDMSKGHYPIVNVQGKAYKKRAIPREDEIAEADDEAVNVGNPPKKRKIVDPTKPANKHARLTCRREGCKRKTQFSCCKCNVALCISPGAVTCFAIYHDKLDNQQRRVEHEIETDTTSNTVTDDEMQVLDDSDAAEEEAARPVVPRSPATPVTRTTKGKCS